MAELPQETVMFADYKHPWKVLEGLNRLRLNNVFCDAILCCEGQEFPCHPHVLASFSTYFEAMFASGTRESAPQRVIINGVEPHMVAVLVNYAYTSKVSISPANVQALLAASNMLDVEDVGNACRHFMWRQVDETELFEKHYHPNKVLEGINRLRRSPDTSHVKPGVEGVPEADTVVMCDVILCSEGQEFPCHRYLLSSFSPYFEAMFTSGMMECTQERVSISGVEPQIIGLLVNYAYTSELSISKANAQALLAAANLWDITAVRKACGDFMKPHVGRNNCVEMYCFSEDHLCDELKKHCMDYILEHFSVIYKQEEFLALSVERLAEIFSSDHLSVPKEDMVFEAAIMWLDKCPSRRQNFEKVLEQIRLPLISPSYLPTVNSSLDVVKDNQGCQKFISEAKERPYSNTAQPRRATVLMTLGLRTTKNMYGYDKVESFDPLTEDWTTLGYRPFRLGCEYAVVASGNTLYLAGGYSDSGASRETWRYDVHHNSWLKIAPMNLGRYRFSLVELDGYVFAVGSRSEMSKATIELYDPQSNTWTLMKSPVVYPTKRSRLVVALEGCLYFIGPKSVQVAKYHPARFLWKKVARFESPLLSDPSAACVLNGKIYITDSGCNLVCFNPETNQSTACDSMERPRHGHNMVVVDGEIHVLGGLYKGGIKTRSGVLDGELDVDCYSAETNKWKTKAVSCWPPGDDHFYCATLRLRNDRVPMPEEYDDPLDDSDFDGDVDNWESAFDTYYD